MPQKNVETIVLIALAVIGALAILAVLGMWLMHATMMGGMMGSGGVSAVAGGMSSQLFKAFIVGAVVILIAIIVMRRSKR